MLPKAKLWFGLLAGALYFWSAGLQAAWDVNMPQGATQISQDTYDLHMIIFWWCVAIGVVVYGVMFWSILRHRKSRGAEPARFHESVKLEIVWTLIPFLILILMAIPATRLLTQAYDTSESELDVQVVGYQWRWEYRYMNGDADQEPVSFFSVMETSREAVNNQIAKGEDYLLDVDRPLVIPTDTKVRLLVTSQDVIHSWWVPELAVKKDAIPGFINETWVEVEEPGVYRGQCAELCGVDHGFMPVVVRAVEPEEFEQWYAEQQEAAREEAALADAELTMDEAMQQGQQVYSSNCVSCHQGDGQGMPPTFPALADSDVVTGDLDEVASTVINGVSGTAMSAFGQQLNPAELAAVITYVRNSFGNDTGDQIQPAEVNEIVQEGQ